MNNIEISSEEHSFESDYLPLISFKTQQQQEAAEEYIFNKAEIFFKKIIKIDIDVEKAHVPYSKLITETDFPEKNIKYFYDYILFDLGKRNNKNNKLDFTPKWGITFDEKCAPILISYLNKEGSINSGSNFRPFRFNNIPFFGYGTIDINGTPIFYYIYFKLQELLDVIKSVK